MRLLPFKPASGLFAEANLCVVDRSCQPVRLVFSSAEPPALRRFQFQASHPPVRARAIGRLVAGHLCLARLVVVHLMATISVRSRAISLTAESQSPG
jgi:hypothetical protein